jgi:hypothetical protein
LAYSMNAPSGSADFRRPVGRFLPNPKLRFLDQCREVLRFKQFAARTEETYVDWIRRFIVWAKDHPRLGAEAGEPRTLTSEPGTSNGEPGGTPGARWRHPKEMGAQEVRGFLTHLAAERNVAAPPRKTKR